MQKPFIISHVIRWFPCGEDRPRAHLSTAALFNAAVDTLPPLGAKSKYDYVIVGGGVAGSVVANHLSENSGVNVLLLEAGPSHKAVLETQVPFWFWLGIPSTYTWNYTTVEQSRANNRTISYPRGHILGGSTAAQSVHGLVFDRATIDDWDKLANLTGDPGWNWESALKYYKKLESMGPPADHHNTTGQFDPSVHGFSGPLGVSLPGFSQDIDEFVLQTLDNKTTFHYIEDPNAGVELGFGWQVSTIHNGTRTTAATAYLADSYLGRPNLDVFYNAVVTRVIVSKGTIDAVEFHAVSENATTWTVRPSEEIIMSAGTVNTPYLLLNSGIGDKATLSSFNITPVHHLPAVGQNMSDTAVMYARWEVNDPNTHDALINNKTARAEALAEWNATRTGRMADGTFNLAGMLRMNDSLPEVQSIRQKYGDPGAGDTAADFELLFINGRGSPSNGTYFTMLFGVLSPISRGSITLDPSNPTGPPLINPNYLSSEYDVLVMRQAILTGFEFLSSHEPWTSYLGTPTEGLGEVIAAVGTNDFSAMDNFVRNSIQNGAHLVGTAAMSPYGADWGVVDPDLHVKGLERLRVVDASVFPFIPGGGTQLPTYCMAERASDLIKSSW
ncbi:hypothetical protein D9757_003047 [Collybiopsis confluens]|uniref:Glucose-methanol-choline oxidoreductase N-terminal domain-containing protein n=1 Tax=Collybiopsis confluens TaxID=2823264 RepID=A0A8H5HX15_9AGAR|nr:hypothetical protein D9757_003047 [Collybiopsis confluens]